MKDIEVQDSSPKANVNIEKEKEKAAIAGAMAGAAGIAAATWTAETVEQKKEESTTKDEKPEPTINHQNNAPVVSGTANIEVHETDNLQAYAEDVNTEVIITDISDSDIEIYDSVQFDIESELPSENDTGDLDFLSIEEYTPTTDNIDYLDVIAPEDNLESDCLLV